MLIELMPVDYLAVVKVVDELWIIRQIFLLAKDKHILMRDEAICHFIGNAEDKG